MGFGRKYIDFPTPSGVVFFAKLAQRIVGIGISVIAILPETTATKIIAVILGGFITISRDIEDMFGVKVHGPVQNKDVDVIRDEAIKILIFAVLVNTYLFIF